MAASSCTFMKRVRFPEETLIEPPRTHGNAKESDPLLRQLHSLGKSFREIAAAVTRTGLPRDAADAQTEEGVFLSCLYFLLHVTERELSLELPQEKAMEVVEELAVDLARNAYGEIFSQDIVPANAREYFHTYFVSNYRLCSRHLALSPLPSRSEEASAETPLLRSFAEWLMEAGLQEETGEQISGMLWNAWLTSDAPEVLKAFKAETLQPG
jgi:hypothetical protein